MLEAGRVIGRDEELVSMAQFVEAAEAGRAVMLIRGEPGIGKTTLWLQAVAEGTRRDFLVLRSRASESERQTFRFMTWAKLPGWCERKRST